MSQTVIGVFPQHTDAQRAVTALQQAGFESAHIDVSSRDHFTNDDTVGHEERHESVGGFFSNLFGMDDHDDDVVRTRTNYTEAARRGTVVTVHTTDMSKAERAADILDEYGAIDANQATAKLRERGIADTDTDTHLEVIKEDLEVGKREVTTGGVRVRSRVISKPVTEKLRLREEHVTVKRTPVNRPVAAGTDAFKEGTISMKETAEVPVVSKTARVVEEISVGKTASEHTETVSDNVRETEVEVDEIAEKDARLKRDGRV